MKKTKKLLAISGFFITLSVSAQNYFNHMDLGVNVSSTGVGADIAMPVGNFVRMRTGFTYMPKFTFTSNFDVQFLGNISADKLRRMKNVMQEFSGQPVQDNVDAIMKPTWSNFKFLVDVFPFRGNKHWSITAGFYVGPSRVGEAINDENAISTLSAVNMYNSMYEKACKDVPMITVEYEDGSMHNFDIPLKSEFVKAGMMGMPLGYFPNNVDDPNDPDYDPHRFRAVMVPNKNCLAKAEMEVSKFRPYVGLGYNTSLSKNGKWKLAVDAGVMFLGGSPHVYVDNVYRVDSNDDYNFISWDQEKFDETGNVDEAWVKQVPQRIDLTRDVTEIPGKVGDMVSTVKKFKCWPVLSITFSHKLF